MRRVRCDGGMSRDWMLEGSLKETASMPGIIISANNLFLRELHKQAGFFLLECPKQMAPGRKGY